MQLTFVKQRLAHVPDIERSSNGKARSSAFDPIREACYTIFDIRKSKSIVPRFHFFGTNAYAAAEMNQHQKELNAPIRRNSITNNTIPMLRSVAVRSIFGVARI